MQYWIVSCDFHGESGGLMVCFWVIMMKLINLWSFVLFLFKALFINAWKRHDSAKQWITYLTFPFVHSICFLCRTVGFHWDKWNLNYNLPYQSQTHFYYSLVSRLLAVKSKLSWLLQLSPGVVYHTISPCEFIPDLISKLKFRF